MPSPSTSTFTLGSFVEKNRCFPHVSAPKGQDEQLFILFINADTEQISQLIASGAEFSRISRMSHGDPEYQKMRVEVARAAPKLFNDFNISFVPQDVVHHGPVRVVIAAKNVTLNHEIEARQFEYISVTDGRDSLGNDLILGDILEKQLRENGLLKLGDPQIEELQRRLQTELQAASDKNIFSTAAEILIKAWRVPKSQVAVGVLGAILFPVIFTLMKGSPTPGWH